MSIPYVLYRESVITENEKEAIQKNVPHHGVDLPQKLTPGTIVFPRFRTIPYGEMLAEQTINAGGHLVNSWEQYQYVSNVNAWKNDLQDLTPAVYTETDIPNLPENEWFVKGETNSDKENWNTSCYAANLNALHDVIKNLHNHPVVGNQKLIIRPFIHYRQLGTMKNNQPICNEWRVFVLHNTIVGIGFYWTTQTKEIGYTPENPINNPKFLHTLNTTIKRINNKIPYVVIDLAEQTNGTWDVIELNDANMSGLCDINPNILWENITKTLQQPLVTQK